MDYEFVHIALDMFCWQNQQKIDTARPWIFVGYFTGVKPQPATLDLNKKSFPKQKTIQNFTIDAQGFRKTKNENPPTWEIEVTS